LDSRGHGETHPLGPVEDLNFKTFVDDLAAILAVFKTPFTSVGGNSMGAGVPMNFALRYPNRVGALVKHLLLKSQRLPDQGRFNTSQNAGVGIKTFIASPTNAYSG
jgi:surfactin synthase thioesterase subunit